MKKTIKYEYVIGYADNKTVLCTPVRKTLKEAKEYLKKYNNKAVYPSRYTKVIYKLVPAEETNQGSQ